MVSMLELHAEIETMRRVDSEISRQLVEFRQRMHSLTDQIQFYIEIYRQGNI